MQSCYFLICVSLSYDINHIRQVNVSSQHLSRSKFSTRSDIIITILLVKILMIPNIAFWQIWRQSTNNYSHKFFVFCSSMTFYRVYGMFFKQFNTYVLYLLIGGTEYDLLLKWYIVCIWWYWVVLKITFEVTSSPFYYNRLHLEIGEWIHLM